MLNATHPKRKNGILNLVTKYKIAKLNQIPCGQNDKTLIGLNPRINRSIFISDKSLNTHCLIAGKLILNDLKSVLDAENPKKVLLVIDEFSTLAGPQLLNILNQGRSLGLHCILTIQSIADLAQKIDRNPNLFIRQILANCNVFWIHRMNAAEDAELLAKTLGTDASMLYTAQIDSFGATGTGSVRPERTFKAHPDDIKHLPTGHGYILNKNNLKMGVQPILGRKGRLADRN